MREMTTADKPLLGIMPPTILLAGVGVMYALNRFFPMVRLWPHPDNYAGLVPLIVGFGLGFYCIAAFYRRRTTIKPFEEPQVLITDGPYNFSRNPIYLGMVMILIGCAILFSTLTPWVVVPAFGAIIQEVYIKREEEMLAEKFGERYERYRQQVRRWV